MTTLNDITGRLQEENTDKLLLSLQDKLLKIQNNIDSDSGKFFLKELEDIIDKSDTKSQKGLNKLNNKLTNLNSSIVKSNSLNESEKNTFRSAISEQSTIVEDNTTLASKIKNIVSNKKDEIADKGLNADISGAVMAVTGSPAFGLAAGFIQDKVTDRIKENVENERERKEQESRIKQHEELKSKEFEFLRTQVSEQDVKEKFNLTENDIQNKATENNTTYEEYLNSLKDSIIEQSSQNKKIKEQNEEIKQEEDSIRKKYGMNDNDNVTSNTVTNNDNITSNTETSNTETDNVTSNTETDNDNVTSNTETDNVTSNTETDNDKVTSIFPTSMDDENQSIEESREISRTQEQQQDELIKINENLSEVVSLLNDGNDIKTNSGDGEGSFIEEILEEGLGEVVGKKLGDMGNLFKRGGISNVLKGNIGNIGSTAANIGSKVGSVGKMATMIPSMGSMGSSLAGMAGTAGTALSSGATALGGMASGAMSTVGTLAAANPIGAAVLGAAALGAGGYALWDHMRGSDESKEIMDTLDEQGIVDHDVIGNSTILNWDAIKQLKPEDLQALIEYDDWDAETLKSLKMIADPKNKNAIDYQEGKEKKETAQQKLDTLEKENINAEKVIKSNEITDMLGLDGVEEFKDPKLQKEKKKLQDDIHKADRQIVKAKESERNRIVGHKDDDENDRRENDITQTQKEMEYLGLTKSTGRELDSKMDLLTENTLENNAAKLDSHMFTGRNELGKKPYENESTIDKLGELSSKAYDYTPLGALTNLTGLTTSESDKIKPYDNPINNQNNALKQNELNNEKFKYEDKNKKESKDSIINAPTSNVNNSKQNITNIIDTSKNSFNQANKGLRGAF